MSRDIINPQNMHKQIIVSLEGGLADIQMLAFEESISITVFP